MYEFQKGVYYIKYPALSWRFKGSGVKLIKLGIIWGEKLTIGVKAITRNTLYLSYNPTWLPRYRSWNQFKLTCLVLHVWTLISEGVVHCRRENVYVTIQDTIHVIREYVIHLRGDINVFRRDHGSEPMRHQCTNTLFWRRRDMHQTRRHDLNDHMFDVTLIIRYLDWPVSSKFRRTFMTTDSHRFHFSHWPLDQAQNTKCR